MDNKVNKKTVRRGLLPYLFIGIIITILYLIYRRLRYAYVVINGKKIKKPIKK